MNENDELKNLPKNVKIRTKDIELDENVSFDDLLLSKQVLDGLKSAAFFKPSPIQLKAIPLGKLGLDLIVQAKSGTGKTCVFTVIALEHVLSSASKALQVLILAPTREVALQICDVVKSVSVNCSSQAKCAPFIGGEPIKQDKIKLKTCQIAVGTPGRILHLMNENLLNTSNIRLFIMDEADKLLAPEFQENINLIFSKLPTNKQILTLSATYPSYMGAYATRYMRSPTYVRLNIVDPSLRGINQYYKVTPYSNLANVAFDNKVDELIRLISTIQFQQCIIFTNYQMKAESLCKSLSSRGWPAIYISGSIEQNQRNFAMSQLKQFKCRILVSTDLTSRGIDAQNVDLVISMDLPGDAETYLHRIGRAGRFGSQGIAVSFITEKEEASQFNEIIDSYNLKIKQYNKDLNDIILTRNEIKKSDNVDDFTIEKVVISKEELDDSLFEYEQYKNSKRYFTSQKNSSSELEPPPPKKAFKQTTSQIKDSISDLNLIDELEMSIAEYRHSKIIKKSVDLNQIQNRYRNILNENNQSINVEQVADMRLRFKNEFALKAKQNVTKSTKSKEKSLNEPISLNSLYKWEVVRVIKSEEDNEMETDELNRSHDAQMEEEIVEEAESEEDDMNKFNKDILAYSYYYSQYYKYFFNKYIQNYFIF